MWLVRLPGTGGKDEEVLDLPTPQRVLKSGRHGLKAWTSDRPTKRRAGETKHGRNGREQQNSGEIGRAGQASKARSMHANLGTRGKKKLSPG